VKHISYFLAAMLAVAVLTPRQGCSQDATKLVPTEPAPARSAAPVKPTPLTVKQTNYNPGNRAKRYFGAGAAGAAEIDSKVSFVDATTGQTLMSQGERFWRADFLEGNRKTR
jgi:hypothetical protein